MHRTLLLETTSIWSAHLVGGLTCCHCVVKFGTLAAVHKHIALERNQ